MKITSPFVKDGDVKLVAEIDVEDIVRLYQQQAGISVSKIFGNLNSISICECSETGYRFYYPFHVAGDGDFYSDIQTTFKKQNIDYYRDWAYDHKFAAKLISDGSKILEVGCGTGKFVEGLQAKNIEFTGLELNPLAVKIGVEKGYDIRNQLVELHAETNSEKYDIVCAFQVLEHIADPGSFIESCLKCLKKGGSLIIGVPNNEPYFQRFNKYETFNLPPHHMALWNLKVFKRLEQIYPILLNEYVYDPKNERVLVDAYLRAKLWAKVKSLPRHHSLTDKLKMLTLATVTLPCSLFDRLRKGINGGYVAVSLKKL